MLDLRGGPVGSPYTFWLVSGTQDCEESCAYVRWDGICGVVLNLDHGRFPGIAEGEICASVKPVSLGVVVSAKIAYAVFRSGLLGFQPITAMPALIHNNTDSGGKRAGITFVHFEDLR